jgi:hypothetical protein
MTYVLLGVAVLSGVTGTLFAKAASEGFRRLRPTLAFMVRAAHPSAGTTAQPAQGLKLHRRASGPAVA